VGSYQTGQPCPRRHDERVGRLLCVSAIAATFAAAALASAGPVGRLPKGPVTFVQLAVGKNYTVNLPQPKVAGRVWRIARPSPLLQ